MFMQVSSFLLIEESLKRLEPEPQSDQDYQNSTTYMREFQAKSETLPLVFLSPTPSYSETPSLVPCDSLARDKR